MRFLFNQLAKPGQGQVAFQVSFVSLEGGNDFFFDDTHVFFGEIGAQVLPGNPAKEVGFGVQYIADNENNAGSGDVINNKLSPVVGIFCEPRHEHGSNEIDGASGQGIQPFFGIKATVVFVDQENEDYSVQQDMRCPGIVERHDAIEKMSPYVVHSAMPGHQ